MKTSAPIIKHFDYNLKPQNVLIMQSLQYRFAKSFLQNVEEKENEPVWKNYLRAVCKNIIKAPAPDCFDTNITQYQTHYTFMSYLLEHIQKVNTANSLLEILMIYCLHTKTPVRETINQLTSNDTSVQLSRVANFLNTTYSGLLKKKCFEIGAGTGSLVNLLTADVGKNYYLSDHSIDKIINHPKCSVVKYDLNDPLPFNDIDLIISCRTIHLASNKEATLKNTYDSLSPEGYFIFCNGNKWVAKERMHFFEITYSFIPGFAEVGGLKNREHWCELLEKTGFTLVELELNSYMENEYTWVIVAQKPLLKEVPDAII